MRLKSMLSASCKLAPLAFVITTATQALAASDQVRQADFVFDGNPFPNDDQDAWCVPSDVPSNCSNGSDFVDVTFDGRWGVGGYAEAKLFSWQISPGDYSWMIVSLRCDGEWLSYSNQCWYDSSTASGTCELTCPGQSNMSEAFFYMGIAAPGSPYYPS